MWYFILYAIIAVWVFVDSKNRMNNVIWWPIGTIIIGPIFLPIYFAKRNLKEGEVREGGTGWNILKNFALFWTLTLFLAGVMAIVGMGAVVSESASDIEKAGSAIGMTLGLGFLAMVWFFPMFGALVIGLFIKKSSVVDRGPTGKLKVNEEKESE